MKFLKINIFICKHSNFKMSVSFILTAFNYQFHENKRVYNTAMGLNNKNIRLNTLQSFHVFEDFIGFSFQKILNIMKL